MKVVLYGAGENCKTFLDNAILDGISIVGILDRNKEGELHGIQIYPVEKIQYLIYDEIFITPQDNKVIIKELKETYNIDGKRIVLPSEINTKYILPQLDSITNCFLSRMRPDSCFSFVFYSLVKKNKMNILRVLTHGEQEKFKSVSLEKKLFVIMSDDVEDFTKSGLIKQLSNSYPNSDFFLWFCNPCNDSRYGIPEIIKMYGSINKLKETFRYCYTYHQIDAQKMGLSYYPQFYPQLREENNVEKKECDEGYDVFFVGNSKNRLDTILGVLHRLNMGGVTCKFYVFGESREIGENENGLEYIDEYIGYDKIVSMIKQSRCILEIVEEGDQTSYRYAEAVVYKKKLLINDDSVREKKYYSKENMQVFKKPDDIDTSWVKEPIIEYDYCGDLEPEYYLHDILGVI